MKTTITSLLLALCMTGAMAQKKITVEAKNADISNNLDLQAVASLFGEVDNLEDFERKLNDYDSELSNLDLNNDGEVDYLRVVESSEKGVHIILIQAVLAKDVFQDVATIAVEKKNNRKTYVQVIGNPFIYGNNYIIEPVYIYTPRIYTTFWGHSYQRWSSPYYWGYYPVYYRYRSPYSVNIYINNVHRHINYSHHYYYRETTRIYYSDNMYRSISRNDYAVRHPDRTFTSRNQNVRNKLDIQQNRGNVNPDGRIVRPHTQASQRNNTTPHTRISNGTNDRSTQSRSNGTAYPRTNESRSNSSIDTRNNANRNHGNVNTRGNENRTNNSRSYSAPTRENSNNTYNNNRAVSPSQSRQNGGENKTPPSVNREYNSRSTGSGVTTPTRNNQSVAPRPSTPSQNNSPRQSVPASRNQTNSNGNRR